jgi:hypothetical protein
VHAPTVHLGEAHKSGHQEKARARGTHILSTQREGLFRTPREGERARSTHQLSTTKGGTSKYMQRKHKSEGYSHPVDRRGKAESEH